MKAGFSAALAVLAVSSLPSASVSFDSNSSFTVDVSFGTPAEAEDGSSNWTSIEQAIIAEHNRVRQDPQSYIPLLEAYLASMTEDGHVMHGCGQNCVLATQEGKSAVEEAIAFLRDQPAVGPISMSPSVAQAARSHAQDQRGGEIGHISSDGSSFLERLSSAGIESGRMAENISYGATGAEEVMMRLLVDDGVPARKHRVNIFAPSWTQGGAGCGTHATYETVCVINYASASL